MITGDAFVQQRDQAMLYGAAGMYIKPINFPEFAEICGELVAGGRSPALDRYMANQRWV